MATRLEKAQIIPLNALPEGSERLIQDMIANDPSILTLGKLELIEKERRQVTGGRIDLLLQDESGKSWYEVEIQRGETDPSHIIRTIEYWDREKRRYPDLRHTAVIVAEEINGRFFNVINLFKGQIPIIALKMALFKLGDRVGVLFTKILDYEPKAGDPDDPVTMKVDRAYWENRCAPFAFKATENLIEFSAKTFNSTIRAKYYRYYIGTTVDGRTSNFFTSMPRRMALQLRMHCKQTDDMDTQLDKAKIRWEYDGGQYPGYRMTLFETEIVEHDPLIKILLERSYQECEGEEPTKGEA